MRSSFPFRLSKGHFHPVLALLAAHGISDIDRPMACLPRYFLCTTVPLPPRIVTIAFCLSSVSHFSLDIGWHGSLALHSAVAAAGVVWGERVAARLMAAYMLSVHLPLHYARLVRARRFIGIFVAVCFTIAILLGTRGVRAVCLSEDAQRLVIAHVWHSMCEAH